MVRPRIYHSAKERQAARTKSRTKWRLANPERWQAILARSYLRRRYGQTGAILRRIAALQAEVRWACE